MDWTAAFDNYCERTDLSYWSEPVNAITNAAFLIAAWIMYQRVAGRGLPIASALCVILAAIGMGSYLFHTHATVWAVTADVIPIVLFTLTYIFAANRDYWDLRPWPALGVTALYFPYSAAVSALAADLPFFRISGEYWSLPLLIGAYAVLLRKRAPATARGLGIGAAILVVSLGFRSVDEILCPSFPMGTHFLWHILNGVMLGWMIEVYRRHMLEGGGAGR